MKFRVMVVCNNARENLPVGEFPLCICGLLWSDMCNVLYNVKLKNPDAEILTKCLVTKDRYFAKFVISGTDYDCENAKIAAQEVGSLLAYTMAETLSELI